MAPQPPPLPRPFRRPWRRVGALALALLAPALAPADIFRYQDAQGLWHFTDEPPPGVVVDQVLDIYETPKRPRQPLPREVYAEPPAGTTDSATAIPASSVAQATHAVVSIRNARGEEGSGFFTSDHGHVITSRHLVQPPEDAVALAGRERALSGQQDRLAALEAEVAEGRAAVAAMEKNLEGYQRIIARDRDEASSAWAREAQAKLTQHHRKALAEVEAAEQQLAAIKGDLQRASQEVSRQRTTQADAGPFEVIRKGGEKLSARLLRVSEAQDLALLQVPQRDTPYLRDDPGLVPTQGMRVLAIGNPLGMQDAVTSGVITRIDAEEILTDAQILAGSSGGPLISEHGVVIAVTTGKSVAAGSAMDAMGFGKAVPIARVRATFPEAFGDPEVAAPAPIPTPAPAHEPPADGKVRLVW